MKQVRRKIERNHFLERERIYFTGKSIILLKTFEKKNQHRKASSETKEF